MHLSGLLAFLWMPFIYFSMNDMHEINVSLWMELWHDLCFGVRQLDTLKPRSKDSRKRSLGERGNYTRVGHLNSLSHACRPARALSHQLTVQQCHLTNAHRQRRILWLEGGRALTPRRPRGGVGRACRKMVEGKGSGSDRIWRVKAGRRGRGEQSVYRTHIVWIRFGIVVWNGILLCRKKK